MKILLILTILLTSVNSYAVTPIKQGEVAPHSGYIFNKAEEKKARKSVKENITLKDLVIKKNQKIEIQSSRIKILNRRIDSLKTTTYGRYLYIGLGVLISGLAVMGASKLKN